MAFNRMYRFKSTIAKYAFNLGMCILVIGGLAILVGATKNGLPWMLFAVLCLVFAYAMEKEMRKK